MKLSIVTPSGKYFDDLVDYVVIDGDNGQIGILENHAPIVLAVSNGFLKRVNNNKEFYYMLSSAIVEFQNNILNVIAQEVAEGDTLKEAEDAFIELRKLHSQENTRQLMDFTKLERDLAKNIKEINASKL